MSERPPEPERGASRYAQPRDEALHLLASEGWANKSGGSLEGPVGWFAKISNDTSELPELTAAFEDDLAVLGVEPRELLGHFLLTESPRDRFTVQQYETVGVLNFAYHALEEIHERWRAEQ